MYATRSENGSTPEFVCHGDKLLVTTQQDTGVALTGNCAIEEYIPGKGWIVRHTFNAAGSQELPSSGNTPTRYRATTAGQSTGVWGVAFR